MGKIAGFLTCSAMALLALSLAACDTTQQNAAVMDCKQDCSELVIAGSTFARPFFDKALESYAKNYPQDNFVYQSVGSGAGIEKFINGKADIGTTDVTLNENESMRIDDDYQEIIVLSGMISLAYNIDGLTGSINLPKDVYSDIFLGNIKRWNDPRLVAANPDITLPANAIQVIARSDSSGTTFAFTHHLSSISSTWNSTFGAAKSIDWPGNTMVARGNEGVSQRLAITKNSIAYVEFGFAKRLGLNVARIENDSGKFVFPDTENDGEDIAVLNHLSSHGADSPDDKADTAYPIKAYTWALIRKQYPSTDKTQAVNRLIKWLLNEGQTLTKPLHYLPLSAELIQTQQQKLIDAEMP